MSRDEDKLKQMATTDLLDSFLTHTGRHRPQFPLPLTCSWVAKSESLTKLSYFSEFIQHHVRVFPIALCASHQSHSDVITFYENGQERDIGLPGIRMKRIDNFAKTVGEFEIDQLMTSESGWDRVKHMYRIKSGVFEDKGLQALNTMWYRTVMMGFFFSAVAGSMKYDKVEKSLSRTDAVRKGMISRVLVPKKVLMTALKDTLKLSVLTFSFLHLSQTISAYKNKSSVWEFTLSSVIGFSALGITKGAYKCGVFAVGGAVLGTVIGWVTCQVLQSSDLTQESRTMKRMQQRREALRLQLETEE